MHLALVWRQKHTQFPGPGRTERNVVGERVWPGFAMKSTGLLFLVAGVVTAMGALFHVNAIWLYGPYDTGAATSYSQPDWYIGFLEGSLRLFPPWEIRIGRFMINNLVFSAVLIPGMIFTGLLLVPWIERRLSRDDREHHLLDRPRDDPHRTAARRRVDHLRRRPLPRRLAGRDRRHVQRLDRPRHDDPADRRPAGPPITYVVTLRRVPHAGRAARARAHRAGRRRRPDAGGGYHEAHEPDSVAVGE